MKATRTWIVIADSGRAHVLENLGPGKGAHRVAGLDMQADLPRTSDIVSDRQGRSFESHGASRHPLKPDTDPRERLKEAFLEEVVAAMEQRRRAGEFDRLVVVAPPSALGKLRAAMPPALAGVVAGEIAKDLTKIADKDIAGHLADVVRL